jgi:hypothetical protein
VRPHAALGSGGSSGKFAKNPIPPDSFPSTPTPVGRWPEEQENLGSVVGENWLNETSAPICGNGGDLLKLGGVRHMSCCTARFRSSSVLTLTPLQLIRSYCHTCHLHCIL